MWFLHCLDFSCRLKCSVLQAATLTCLFLGHIFRKTALLKMGWLLIISLNIKAKVLALQRPTLNGCPAASWPLLSLAPSSPRSATQPPGHSLSPSHTYLGTLQSRNLFPQEPMWPILSLPWALESNITSSEPTLHKIQTSLLSNQVLSFLLYFSP